MKIFLTGATGFIGRHLVDALLERGHQLVCAVRGDAVAMPAPPGVEFCRCDFATDFAPAVWAARLVDVDVVVNAVGIIRERNGQTFDALHVRAPSALFAAAASAGLRCVQVSALGADADARSRYHTSKKHADDYLASVSDQWVIAQPSLVFGAGGDSTRLFTALAALPLIPLPGRGEQQVQPILIDDAVEALVVLIESREIRCRRIALVGPRPLGLRMLLTQLRLGMRLPQPRFLPVPEGVVRASARVAGVLPGSLLDAETFQMLVRGNTADPAGTRGLLRRDPRPVDAWFVGADRDAMSHVAALSWLLPVLRCSVALVWIVTGIVSLGLYPRAESYALLARSGVPAALEGPALYGAAMLDLALGAATLLLRKRRRLWLLQIALILVYTVIITIKLPEFWLHPFGPILKNLPLLAALWLLYTLEPR